MKLDVPIVIQDRDSKECSLAGLSMLFKYYGLDIPLGQLKSEIEVDETGTYIPQLGSYLIKRGFNVEIVTMHPSLFTKKDELMSSEEILRRFKDMYEKSESEKNKKVLNHFIQFINDGGTILVKIPSKRDLINEINEKRPVCALLTSNFLGGEKPIFNFHFNLVTGIDDGYVYVNDPAWDGRGGSKKYVINDFFYGYMLVL